MSSSVPSTGSTKVDAVVQKAVASTSDAPKGLALYSRFALAGAVCCSITHGALTPVDVYVTSFSRSSLLLLIAAVLDCASVFVKSMSAVRCQG